MIIFFIFLYLVFEIKDILQGRTATLYTQSNKEQELQSCEFISGWTRVEVEAQT